MFAENLQASKICQIISPMFQIQTKTSIPKYKTCLIIQQSSTEQLQYTKYYYRLPEYSHVLR